MILTKEHTESFLLMARRWENSVSREIGRLVFIKWIFIYSLFLETTALWYLVNPSHFLFTNHGQLLLETVWCEVFTKEVYLVEVLLYFPVMKEVSLVASNNMATSQNWSVPQLIVSRLKLYIFRKNTEVLIARQQALWSSFLKL